MPAKDKYHDHVREALEAEGWTITDEPFRLDYGTRSMFADLAAERHGAQIVVEIKTLPGETTVSELHQAVGQYVVYQSVMAVLYPDHTLYLAIPMHSDIFDEPLGELVMRTANIHVVGYHLTRKELIWTLD